MDSGTSLDDEKSSSSNPPGMSPANPAYSGDLWTMPLTAEEDSWSLDGFADDPLVDIAQPYTGTSPLGYKELLQEPDTWSAATALDPNTTSNTNVPSPAAAAWLQPLHGEDGYIEYRSSHKARAASVAPTGTVRATDTPTERHSTSGDYVCQYPGCGKRYATMAKLNHHKRYHIPYHERPNVCDQCGARFVFKRELDRHKQSITHARRDFICTHCNAGFALPEHLNRHIIKKCCPQFATEPLPTAALHTTLIPDGFHGHDVSLGETQFKTPTGDMPPAEIPKVGFSSPPVSVGETPTLTYIRTESSQQGKVQNSLTTLTSIEEVAAQAQQPYDTSIAHKCASGLAQEDCKGQDQEDDRLTCISGSTAETNVLAPDQKYKLALGFAGELYNTLAASVGVLRAEADEHHAARLLKVYSMMLRDHAVDGENRKACRFVRQQRKLISKLLRRRLNSTDDDDEVRLPDVETMTLKERMERWFGELDPTGYSNMVDATGIANPPSDDSAQASENAHLEDLDSVLPDVPRMQHFLTTNLPWQWLKCRMTQRPQELQWPYGIMDALLSAYESPSSKPDIYGRHQLEVTVQWNPESYLRQHFEDVNAKTLGRSIVLSGQKGKLQACTCEEYLTQNWDLVGSAMLHVLQESVTCGLSGAGTYEMLERSTVSFQQKHGLLVVHMCAQMPILIELTEQLAWLGASCAVSPYPEKSCYRRMSLVSTDESANPTHQSLAIEYETSEVDALANCWTHVVKNPSIAQDFPATARQPGFSGMEMSLDMMIKLGDILWATVYANKFMLKGFSSAFYPVAIKAKSVLWHFVCTPHDEHLPYAAAGNSCAGAEALVGMDISWLRSSRHFIGWTPDAESILGTKDYDYASLGYPNNIKRGSNLKLERVVFSGGQYLTVGASITKGDHHRGIFNSDISNHRRMINHARRQYMALYDTGLKRAYLTDGASALFHLMCLQLNTAGHIYCTDDPDVFKRVVYADPTKNEPSVTALLDKGNLDIVLGRDKLKNVTKVTRNDKGVTEETQEDEYRVFEVRDLVRDNYLVLSKLWARSSEDTTGMDLRFTARPRVEGWSLLELVEDEACLEPVTVYLQESGSGWLDLVRSIKAPVLMATGIGEPIVATRSSCQRWSTVPIGKDYFACTVPLLHEIAIKKGQSDLYPEKLLSDLVWHGGHSLFEPCDGRTKHGSECCDRIQALYSSRRGRYSSPALPAHQSYGAVIFGCSSRYDSTSLNVLDRSWTRVSSTLNRQRGRKSDLIASQDLTLRSSSAHLPHGNPAGGSCTDDIIVPRPCPGVRVWTADSGQVAHEDLATEPGADQEADGARSAPSSGSSSSFVSTVATGSSPPGRSSHVGQSSVSSQTSQAQSPDSRQHRGSDVMGRWSSMASSDGYYDVSE
ncbi:hypothetical protein LTR56_002586 [Elasticomyces elasticus]|nr:hypothetical protein LTR22_013488 [Elasticomyces elasticus]KAK3657072.1 hypothetical protein LTR56_002586 [Elasticomyces elasticus]KAK4926699.1 hypothetical protein LTR49_006381 [Elasticomyces elasticus]KAK5762350.1 hypothetical protein LTS12_007509 [Elasticomyces elasticus]